MPVLINKNARTNLFVFSPCAGDGSGWGLLERSISSVKQQQVGWNSELQSPVLNSAELGDHLR